MKYALSKSSPTVSTLARKICNCFESQSFLIYLAKYIWSFLNSPKFFDGFSPEHSRQINLISFITLKIYYHSIILHQKKEKKLALTSFFFTQSRNMIRQFMKIYLYRPNQDSAIYYKWGNLKMFHITSNYFSIFNNKSTASWVAHVTSGFLTCYCCSYFSFMILVNIIKLRLLLCYSDRWNGVIFYIS